VAQLVGAKDCQSLGRQFDYVKKPDNSNSHEFELHRPSNKGTKLHLKVIKAIIIIKRNIPYQMLIARNAKIHGLYITFRPVGKKTPRQPDQVPCCAIQDPLGVPDQGGMPLSRALCS